MSDSVIQATGLTKSYGRQRGVIDLDFRVERGEVFGYLGPNGAGKTTTIRTLLDFIRPSRGQALIFGQDTRRASREIHRRIGYLPGELALYGNLNGADTLRYLAALRGGVDWPFVEELAARLESDLTRPTRTLSHGNKQKIGLIQAFMHRPDLLILDEPTGGLDPLVQQAFYTLIEQVRADGRTVFLSSHVLPEVERVCDRVGIIRAGRLVAVERVAALKARSLRPLEIRFAVPVPEMVFAGLPGVRELSVDGALLRCSVTGSVDAVIKAAAQFEVLDVVSREPTLEEIFLAYYGGGANDAA